MAVFSAETGNSLNKINDKAVRDYLYKLNEDLNYMFENLTPEDNYSQNALNVLAVNEKMMSELSVSVDGISARVADNEGRTSALEISVDGISANMISKGNIVSAINLSTEGVKIKGDRITLDGAVSIGEKVKIDSKTGILTAVDGVFSGTLKGDIIANAGVSCVKLKAAVAEIEQELVADSIWVDGYDVAEKCGQAEGAWNKAVDAWDKANSAYSLATSNRESIAALWEILG